MLQDRALLVLKKLEGGTKERKALHSWRHFQKDGVVLADDILWSDGGHMERNHKSIGREARVCELIHLRHFFERCRRVVTLQDNNLASSGGSFGPRPSRPTARTEDYDILCDVSLTKRQWLALVGECQILKEAYDHINPDAFEICYETMIENVKMQKDAKLEGTDRWPHLEDPCGFLERVSVSAQTTRARRLNSQPRHSPTKQAPQRTQSCWEKAACWFGLQSLEEHLPGADAEDPSYFVIDDPNTVRELSHRAEAEARLFRQGVDVQD
eukprot:4815033-Amphidinium_carterae.1